MPLAAYTQIVPTAGFAYLANWVPVSEYFCPGVNANRDVAGCSTSCPGGCEDMARSFDGSLSTMANPSGPNSAFNLVYRFNTTDALVQKVVIYAGDATHDRSDWTFAVSNSAASSFVQVARFSSTPGVSPKNMAFAPLSTTRGQYIQVLTNADSWQPYIIEIYFYGLTCPAGFYVNASGAAYDACVPCRAGTYSTAAGGVALPSSCTPCPAGTYGTAVGGTSAASACDGVCSGGSYSTGGATQCSRCLSGTYGPYVSAGATPHDHARASLTACVLMMVHWMLLGTAPCIDAAPIATLVACCLRWVLAVRCMTSLPPLRRILETRLGAVRVCHPRTSVVGFV